MKVRERQERMEAFIASRRFTPGKSTYVEEYRAWLKGPKNFLPLLLGIYEVAHDEFCTKHPDDLLRSLGHVGLEVINYDPDSAEYFRPNPTAHVTGFTCAARSSTGQVRSAIFMRETVLGTEGIPPERLDETIAWNKLGVLLHELGHAHDIEHQFHYNHSRPSFDAVNGEFYAHKFSYEIAERCNYRVVMDGIFARMKTDAESDEPVYREAARMMLRRFQLKRMPSG